MSSPRADDRSLGCARALPLILVAVVTAACGPAPAPRPKGPIAPQPLSLRPRIVRDAHVGRAVVVPEFLREVSPPAGVWLRLEFRDEANPTGVVVDFLTECPEIQPRAVPCGGGRPCLMEWRQGQELLAGRAALSVGEHLYWWPGPIGTCARIAYSLGPGQYAAALERFVLDFPDQVRPARLRPPASAPASQPGPGA
jgi:hypothetical protein